MRSGAVQFSRFTFIPWILRSWSSVLCRPSSTACQSGRLALAIPRLHNKATSMANLLLLPGDGIGPDAMAEAERLPASMHEHVLARFAPEAALVAAGGSARDALAVTQSTA